MTWQPASVAFAALALLTAAIGFTFRLFFYTARRLAEGDKLERELRRENARLHRRIWQLEEALSKAGIPIPSRGTSNHEH